MGDVGRTPDLFAPAVRQLPAAVPTQEGSRCGTACLKDRRGGFCFLSEDALDAYLADCARAREAAEVRSMLHWTSLETERFLGRVLIKRGATAAQRLEAALKLARQKREAA
jgi:hypothetical protein